MAGFDFLIRYQPRPTRIDAQLHDEAEVYELADTIDACFEHADLGEIYFRERMCRLCGCFTRRPLKIRRSARWHVVCPPCAEVLRAVVALEAIR